MTKGEIVETNPFLEAEKIQYEFKKIETCSLFYDLEKLKEELSAKVVIIEKLEKIHNAKINYLVYISLGSFLVNTTCLLLTILVSWKEVQ